MLLPGIVYCFELESCSYLVKSRKCASGPIPDLYIHLFIKSMVLKCNNQDYIVMYVCIEICLGYRIKIFICCSLKGPFLLLHSLNLLYFYRS